MSALGATTTKSDNHEVHASTFGGKVQAEPQRGIIVLDPDAGLSGGVSAHVTEDAPDRPGSDRYFRPNVGTLTTMQQVKQYDAFHVLGTYDPKFFDVETLRDNPQLKVLLSEIAKINSQYIHNLSNYLDLIDDLETQIAEFLPGKKLGSKADLLKGILLDKMADYTLDYVKFTSRNKGTELLNSLPERYRQPIRDRINRIRNRGGLGGSTSQAGGKVGTALKTLNEWNLISGLESTGAGALEIETTGGYSSEAHERANKLSGLDWYNDHIKTIPVLGTVVDGLVGDLYRNIASAGASFSQTVSKGIFGGGFETDQEKYDKLTGHFRELVNGMKELSTNHDNLVSNFQKPIQDLTRQIEEDVNMKVDADKVARSLDASTFNDKGALARQVLDFVSRSTGRSTNRLTPRDIEHAQQLMRTLQSGEFQDSMRDYYEP